MVLAGHLGGLVCFALGLPLVWVVEQQAATAVAPSWLPFVAVILAQLGVGAAVGRWTARPWGRRAMGQGAGAALIAGLWGLLPVTLAICVAAHQPIFEAAATGASGEAVMVQALARSVFWALIFGMPVPVLACALGVGMGAMATTVPSANLGVDAEPAPAWLWMPFPLVWGLPMVGLAVVSAVDSLKENTANTSAEQGLALPVDWLPWVSHGLAFTLAAAAWFLASRAISANLRSAQFGVRALGWLQLLWTVGLVALWGFAFFVLARLSVPSVVFGGLAVVVVGFIVAASWSGEGCASASMPTLGDQILEGAQLLGLVLAGYVVVLPGLVISLIAVASITGLRDGTLAMPVWSVARLGEVLSEVAVPLISTVLLAPVPPVVVGLLVLAVDEVHGRWRR